MRTTSLLVLSATALLAAAPAFAQVAATAATDLNLRAGPAGNEAIVGVIPSGDTVQVQGCLDAANWCQVDYNGTQGWAYGEYLNGTTPDNQQMAVTEAREPLQVGTVIYTAPAPGDEAQASANAAVGAVGAGAVAAALIGGPAAIAAGAALGAVAGAAATDPAVTYAQSNPVDPVYMDGEVVVGAGIPPEVTLVPVPDTQYSYLNVNGLPVIIDNSNRQIVRIVR